MFGLINMNARLCDPAVGRFLSPAPFIQASDFTQNLASAMQEAEFTGISVQDQVVHYGNLI
jgi:hypothetical protein